LPLRQRTSHELGIGQVFIEMYIQFIKHVHQRLFWDS
jgi:hypothetical protein